ncbi:hypothetical protein Barb6_02639 [Bacteroidales bacterium Barb6]|nr:hypothetical protein Barb6_02639 [Bacteroidales bacterium Barb6]
MKEIKPVKSNTLHYYMAGLTILFAVTFSYTFNSKIDINGDNCAYYMLATSIAGGHGYSDITSEAYNPTNVFPPGYPLLMSFIRIFTDGFFPQKVLNGLFLLGSVLLLFFFVRKNKLPDSLAFVASAVVLLNYQVLHFATMMMSEMSFLFFAVLTLWFLCKADDGKPFWKDRYFYLAIFSAAYCYHVRTQGIAMAAAVLGYFLFTKRWKEMLAFAGGFVVCLMPWMLRNRIIGTGQSRYLSMINIANPWRPETGTLSVSEIISRFFETFGMLVSKAVPNSILPYFSTDYISPSVWSEWGTAVILFAVIGIGIWQLGRYKYLFLFYIVATFGVISLFSTPSENRYITSLLPFLEVGLIVGLYTVLSFGIRKMKITKAFSPWLLIPLFFFSYPKLEQAHAQNKAPFPANYRNFFAIAEEVHKKLPASTMVCSRKSELFYMYGKNAVCGYVWTEDDRELIQGLIQSKTEYVVVEQLGYSSTARYLYPAVQKHPELFKTVIHLPDPDTYLLKFDREKAVEKFNK